MNFKKFTYKILNRIDITKGRKYLFKKLSVINIRFKGYPAFVMSDYFKIVDRSDPKGYYVFLSTDSKSLGSISIKKIINSKEYSGYFTHAGLMFQKGERETSIMHVTADGLIEQPLIDFLKQVDYFCVIRLPVNENNSNSINIRLAQIRDKADKIKYDWEGRLDNDENLLYCSELVYKVFKDLINIPEFKPRLILGRYVFEPNLLLKCGEVVYCNHPELKDRSPDSDYNIIPGELIPLISCHNI